jgi:hypothetical protein
MREAEKSSAEIKRIFEEDDSGWTLLSRPRSRTLRRGQLAQDGAL